MNTTEFEQALARDGFVEAKSSELKPGHATTEHHHHFEVRALVLEGEIALTFNGARHTYRSGEVFTMDAGCPHAETIGAAGVRYIAGRKYPAERN